MTRTIQNWMILCSILYYTETKEPNQNWMIIAYHEKTIQIWMITDGQNHPFLEPARTIPVSQH